MKKIKINLLAIIGMMVAVATFAFTVPEKNVVLEEQYWFAMDLAGTNPTHVIATPDPNCPKLATPNCARLYNKDQTEVLGTDRQVIEEEINEQVDFRTLRP